MNTVLSTTELIQELTHLQDLTRLLEQPWNPAIESYTKIIQSMNLGTYDWIMKTYSSQTELYKEPVFHDGTSFLRPDTEDGTEDDSERIVFFSTSKNCKYESADYSTRSVDINKVNQEDLEYFRSRSKEIVNALKYTDFEDGMDNDVTELIRSFVKRNKSATYNWLNDIYGRNHQDNAFVEGLLRTLAMVTEKGDETMLLAIVIAGLFSGISSEQEAALMVIEEWRTKECYEVLKSVSFQSDWIADYAQMVKSELEEELGIC